jgi:hypothetical protein
MVIRITKWPVTMVNMKGLSILFMVNPRSYSEDENLDLLHKATNDTNGEMFHITSTNTWISSATNPNSKLNAHVFEIQSPSDKTNIVLEKLLPVYPNDKMKGVFIPYSHKYSHEDNYRKYILMHNKYVEDHWIVPITGVCRNAMTNKSTHNTSSIAESLFAVRHNSKPVFLELYSTNKPFPMAIGI